MSIEDEPLLTPKQVALAKEALDARSAGARFEVARCALTLDPYGGASESLDFALRCAFDVPPADAPATRRRPRRGGETTKHGLVAPGVWNRDRPVAAAAACVTVALRDLADAGDLPRCDESDRMAAWPETHVPSVSTWDSLLAHVRLAFIYRAPISPQVWAQATKLLDRPHQGKSVPLYAAAEILSYPSFGVSWSDLPEVIRLEVAKLCVARLWRGGPDWPRTTAALPRLFDSLPTADGIALRAELSVWEGEITTIERLELDRPRGLAEAWLAAAAVLRGEKGAVDRLRAAGRAAFRGAHFLTRLPDPLRVLYACARLAEGTAAARTEAESAVQRPPGEDFQHEAPEALAHFLATRRGEYRPPQSGRGRIVPSDLDLIAHGCVRTFAGEPLGASLTQALEAIVADPGERSAWLRAEAASLLEGTSAAAVQARSWRELSGAKFSLAAAITPTPPWRLRLDALEQEARAATRTASDTGGEPDERLVWRAEYRQHAKPPWFISPRLQKRTKSGWTGGRDVAIRRLVEAQASPPPWFTEPDRLVIARAAVSYSSGYGQPTWDLDSSEAAAALVGHPLVFLAHEPERRLELVAGQVALRTRAQDGGVVLEIEPWFGDRTVLVVDESPYRGRVYCVPPEVARVRSLIGSKGLWVPSEGAAQLDAVVRQLTGMLPVQSSEDTPADAQPGDVRPRILLGPSGGGVTVTLRVRPLGDDSPAFGPGEGGRAVMARIGERIASATRDLPQERALALTAAHMLGLPEPDLGPDRSWAWTLDDPIDTLELLSAAATLGDAAVVEWPEGGKFAPPRPVDRPQVKVRVRSSGDWLSLQGEVQIDEETVFALGELLRLYAARRRGRFVALDSGQVLALTEALRRQLDDLVALTHQDGTQDPRFPRVAALAVEPALDGLGQVKGDKAWRDWLTQLRSLASLQPPVPPALRSVLRPYQEDGYAWMARLAASGLGACLADDMGLGKTVQALALLTHRAADGPALVVAPTSVASNWAAEAVRFAPELRPRLFGSGDRQATLDDAGPFDVVITTYGLLLSEAERFAARRWTTVVLDEAQSIKNADAKRSKAAMSLQADFRLATTGTPVENRLDELWSLFRFLIPGLLGTREQFDRRFGTPIETHRDPHARRALKALVSPFILRRTKAQVLTDLPPKTEIVVPVTLSETERALYEALRRRAVTALQSPPDAASPPASGGKHLQVLAELMRLRRACCHPRLVVPQYTGPSAKADAFLDIVDELRAGEHRALVFSQFVDHLTEIRHRLDERGVSYQYLDGSTPAKRRDEAVTAFQAGHGELFLISLRAGGTGLNLTAADYVVHLDPWWNPAVEDQASDRAHRIGQTRPVTVYRLVTEGTVEHKILELHHRKRDLAASLLEGTEDSSRLDLDALLALLQ